MTEEPGNMRLKCEPIDPKRTAEIREGRRKQITQSTPVVEAYPAFGIQKPQTSLRQQDAHRFGGYPLPRELVNPQQPNDVDDPVSENIRPKRRFSSADRPREGSQAKDTGPEYRYSLGTLDFESAFGHEDEVVGLCRSGRHALVVGIV